MRSRNVVLIAVVLGAAHCAAAQSLDAKAAAAEGQQLAADCRKHPSDPRSARCADICTSVATATQQSMPDMLDLCRTHRNDVVLSAEAAVQTAAPKAGVATSSAATTAASARTERPVTDPDEGIAIVTQLGAECRERWPGEPRSNDCIKMCTNAVSGIPGSKPAGVATIVKSCRAIHASVARAVENKVQQAAFKREQEEKEAARLEQEKQQLAASAQRQLEPSDSRSFNFYLVAPSGLYALEIDSDVDGVIEYRKFVDETSPFLEGRGTMPGEYAGNGILDTKSLALRYRNRVINRKITAACGKLYDSGEVALRTVTGESGKPLPNVWVTDGSGTCALHNYDLLTCSEFDCQAEWTPDHQEVIVMGQERARKIWQKMPKRPDTPETVIWKWIPYNGLGYHEAGSGNCGPNLSAAQCDINRLLIEQYLGL